MPVLNVLTDVTDTAAGTNTTVTALSIPVAANRMYFVTYELLHATTDITDGIQLIIDAPGTPTNFAVSGRSGTGAATETVYNSITDAGEFGTVAMVGTTGTCSTLKVWLKTPTAGELIIQIDAENAGDVTVEAGSFVQYRDQGAV